MVNPKRFRLNLNRFTRLCRKLRFREMSRDVRQLIRDPAHTTATRAPH